VILGVVNDAGALAAVDCGTNSTRLLVVGPAGDVRAREMRITRLGEGVDATRRLGHEALGRTFAVLRDYRVVMDAERVVGTRLVATSAVRDAANGQDFLDPAADIIGAPAELLSGEEEGQLSYAGATSDLPAAGAGVVVLDIGGGSTEIVTKPSDTIASVSLDIGCVRLTERFLRRDPPSEGEVSAAVAAIARELDRATQVVPALAGLGPASRLVGLAGTVSTLASLELGLVAYDRERIHHAVLSLPAVVRWCDILGAERLSERARRRGLPAGRRDVIFGGALVLREVMTRFGFHECVVSEADILDGLVMSLERPPRGKRPDAG
jgi:exopolyphosphatase / guanosine-5'-triphosphate,3'-diphosphate pyrophosphatase